MLGLAMLVGEPKLPPFVADQLKVVAAVVEAPSRVSEVMVQVRALLVPAFTFGTVLFNDTVTEEVAVQPFAVFVTRTTYTPTVVAVGLARVELYPPTLEDHRYVTAGVIELPSSVTLLTTQVRVFAEPAEAFGGTKSAVTLTLLEAVQPFAGSVTTTVYTPAESTAGLRMPMLPTKCPPTVVQANETPTVAELPPRITLEVTQFSTFAAPADAFGGVLLPVTVTVSRLIQPLAGFVTATTYIPSASTETLATVAGAVTI